jgi:translation initiation factor IF-3
MAHPRTPQKAPPGKLRRINEEITAPRLSVISDEGEPLGVLSRDEALALAEEKELDLVEMGIQDGVVLAKVMDYGKFLFKQQKTQSQARSHSKKADVKTLKLTYKIGEHDIEIRRGQALKFGAAGHPLKIELRLRGRENHYGDLATAKMQEFINSLGDAYKLDAKITRTGNTFSTLLYPKK